MHDILRRAYKNHALRICLRTFTYSYIYIIYICTYIYIYIHSIRDVKYAHEKSCLCMYVCMYVGLRTQATAPAS